MAAKRGFEIGRVEREEEIAQGVERRSAPEADAEHPAHTLAMDVDERDDALVRGCPGEHRQNREQQQRGERIASALWAARVADLGQRGEQERKRHQATSTKLDAAQT